MAGFFVRLTGGLLSLMLATGCTVYQSIGKSTGSFLHPVSGHDFVHIQDSDWNSQDNALIYFYRTHSRWASEEIEAPSVYVDDHHYFNLRNNSFTWLEVAPGERHIEIRRPLLGLEGLNDFSLSKIADAMLPVEAGEIYYLRYKELEPPEDNPDFLPEDHPLSSGTLQLVTRDYAMTANELVSTQFLNSDLLAPNHAATSIVEATEAASFERRMTELEKKREEQIADMKKSGRYQAAPWYWPFGGGPTETPPAEKQMEALQEERQARLAKREEEEDGWWIF
ncbi:hypothetical protein CF392_09660 [Tamilnaduibacter salinus]|uniref:DUF2846 domain-containing protein n=1 Tax=Tamilnaduibacter salinus TaxID=1484056 RepID=A0A2A2I2Q3_9GAMM|nr:DUF2846 domain-containing protein [Tamilnaduibacter salinus]PAV25698.1 hypothetical protein CF392_09660 [Tamilnaduibacter salinus]